MIIDLEDGFEVLQSDFPNEVNRLKTLEHGLHCLYKQVKGSEFTPTKVTSFTYGVEKRPFLECCFHWYSVSLCNYLWIVGWLKNNKDDKKAKAFVGQIVPSVQAFRDKIGAHYAFHQNCKHDNEAEKDLSKYAPIYGDQRQAFGHGFQDSKKENLFSD